MTEEIKTPAEASESNTSILPRINTDVKHLEELRTAALDYVSKGYSIVPMGYNHTSRDYKFPLIRWREVGPLLTEEGVNNVFKQLQGKVFGIATVVNGYTLVDFDTTDTDKLFNIPPTPTIKTGKGYHLWYRADENLDKNGPVDLSFFEKRDGKKYQMEVYTSKRLEVLPPSKHHSGVTYDWLIPLDDFLVLPELPEDIAILCKPKNSNPEKNLNQPVTEGGRHPALMDKVKELGRTHKGDKMRIEAGALSWNIRYCTPPLEPAEVISMTNWVVDNYQTPESETKESKGKKLNRLLNDNNDIIKLFHDQNEIGYARIQFKGRSVNVPVKSSEFKEFIRYVFYQETKDSISNLILEESVSLCLAKAIYEGEQYSLFHRVAQVDNTFYYDLSNKKGEIVKINELGWSVVPGEEMPFLFKTGCCEEQVTPTPGGNLKDLLNILNIGDSDEQMLFISTLPVRLIREVDQAIAYIYGPAGSGKTTVLKMTKNLLDPSTGGISMPIKKVEDAVPLLSQTWVFANDNISKINDELSDFFCVVATGAENSRRSLYTNSDLTVFTLKNPAYLTGVNIEAYRSDLMSRMLLFKTDAVPIGNRLANSELHAKYTALKPQLLGALFDTLSKAIKIKHGLDQKTEFRMADFSLWGAACAEVLGYGAEHFETAIQKATKNGAYDAVYSLSAGRALLEMLETEDYFEGTATELLRKLKETDSHFDWHEDVARNPATLSRKLRELENSFAVLGISIDYGNRTSKERTIVIRKIYDSNDRVF